MQPSFGSACLRPRQCVTWLLALVLQPSPPCCPLLLAVVDALATGLAEPTHVVMHVVVLHLLLWMHVRARVVFCVQLASHRIGCYGHAQPTKDQSFKQFGTLSTNVRRAFTRPRFSTKARSILSICPLAQRISAPPISHLPRWRGETVRCTRFRSGRIGECGGRPEAIELHLKFDNIRRSSTCRKQHLQSTSVDSNDVGYI